MSNLETLINTSQWGDVVELLENKWQTTEPTAVECFYRSLAAFATDDLFTAYNYGVNSFEMDGEVAVVCKYLASLCVLVGREKESYFYRKMLSVLDDDKKISDVIPAGLIPDYTDLLSQIEENQLLRRGVKAELQEQWEDAEHWYLQHISFEPHDKNGYLSIVRCQLSQERVRAASESLKGARALFPEDETFASLMGDVLTRLGQFNEAEACYKWAIDHAPFDEKVHARYLRGLVKNPTHDFARCAEEMKTWTERHVQEIRGAMPPAELGERSFLRVGFLLKGVDRTRIAPAIGGVLSWHDQDKFQFIGYGEGDVSYPFNRYFKTAFSEWRDIGQTDAMTLRNMVIADGIDILIDMGGINSSETMRCFGSRLAPAQILWADNNLSGLLPEIDFVVTDRCPEELKDKHVTVEGSSAFSACRDVLDGEVERTDERLSFVADVTFEDLSVDTVSLWAKVLLANPESVLLLRSHDFYAEDNSRTLIELFGIFGIAHRIDVVQEPERRRFFSMGDVGLLPVSGASVEVILDALVAGVPLVANTECDIHASKGVDVLNALGLGADMVFNNQENYVKAASDWALDEARRIAFKENIIEKLEASVFYDTEKRMSHVHDFLHDIWDRKCAQKA